MDTNNNREKLPYGTKVSVDGRTTTVIEDYGLKFISVRFDETVQGCRPLVQVEASKAVVL